MQLITLFAADHIDITFASSATPSEHSADLQKFNIRVEQITLNDPSFDAFILKLNPDVVLFDRFISEEQFGWRVAEVCPNALRILDTEDLHFLRKAREDAVKQGKNASETDLHTDLAKREIASIFRSDLSLLISEKELALLQEEFRIPSELLYYLPFLVEIPSEAERKRYPHYNDRSNFMTVGNFLHSPNVDAVVELKKEIWPRIRKQLPEAKLCIYGAYPPEKIQQLHNEKEGFLIKGWVEDIDIVVQQARVSLAPLRFGAGLKGKLITALKNGTPVVTTTIGSEGINLNSTFDDVPGFVKEAVTLYTEEQSWISARNNGFRVLSDQFNAEVHADIFIKRVDQLQKELNIHRGRNFIGQILQHHSMQSTKYLSRWIEAKNRGDSE